MKNRFLATLLVLLSGSPLLAQRTSANVYRVRIFTAYGARIEGILYEVTDSLLFYREPNAPLEIRAEGEGAVLLSEVEKVVLRREVKRAPAIRGAFVGAAGGGYLSFLSLRKYPPRSPVLYGVTLVSGVAGGAVIGALTGSIVGRVPRRIFRANGAENAATLLGTQLRPFAYRNQMDVRYDPPRQRK